jgi:hypothetical protein
MGAGKTKMANECKPLIFAHVGWASINSPYNLPVALAGLTIEIDFRRHNAYSRRWGASTASPVRTA